MAYLDKHSTLDLVMVSVVSTLPSGGRQLLLKCFELLNVNSGLKCKCDLIVKNSNAKHEYARCQYRGLKCLRCSGILN